MDSIVNKKIKKEFEEKIIDVLYHFINIYEYLHNRPKDGSNYLDILIFPTYKDHNTNYSTLITVDFSSTQENKICTFILKFKYKENNTKDWINILSHNIQADISFLKNQKNYIQESITQFYIKIVSSIKDNINNLYIYKNIVLDDKTIKNIANNYSITTILTKQINEELKNIKNF